MERILVVEDDSFFRQMYVDLLKEDGYEVETVTSGARALELLAGSDYQLVITELVIPGMSGIELLARVKQQVPTVDVILVTGHANVESAVLALKSGARDYLLKPFNHEEFKHTVSLCFEQRRLINENYELKELLNLFQVGQNIANCIDMERLSAVVLDALTAEVGADRAIGLFHQRDDKLSLKNFKGFDEETAQKLAETIRKNFCIEIDNGPVLKKITTNALVLGGDFDGLELSEGLLLVIRSKADVQGVVVIFNNPGQKLSIDYKQKSIHFLLEQSTLAFENAARYSSARDMLYIDELTGLFNYRYLDISLDREIKRADRFGSTVSMIFIDLDFFKGVNDTHGHLVGSQVLNEMGMLL
ncbi:MAG: diguanylate cyclase, partial [Deltaproteobacteria bacterium]|nr:diguanylate cyclase [Deltaproteobacteria bacterium]